MNFDYINVVVELTCINDKLILTILNCSKEQWPEVMAYFVSCLLFNSS